MKKTYYTIMMVAALTASASAQTVIDELDWIPSTAADTYVNMAGATFSNPNGDYSMTGDALYTNSSSTSNNIRWSATSDNPVTLNFNKPITSFSIGAYSLNSTETLTFSIAPTSASSGVILSGNTATADNTIGTQLNIYWETLPSGTTSITLDADVPDGTGVVGFTSVSYTTVPEPSSSALLGLGVMGLLARRKR